MATKNQTSNFIELHWVVDFTPSCMRAEPVTINKRHICKVHPAKNFEAEWDKARTKVTLPNESIYVTETYEEVRAMLMED